MLGIRCAVLSHPSKHIVTLEDPIGFVHGHLLSLVTQREIDSDTRDFAVGLRHVVRESADVLLIGEMQDAATMPVALSAARHAGGDARARGRQACRSGPPHLRRSRAPEGWRTPAAAAMDACGERAPLATWR